MNAKIIFVFIAGVISVLNVLHAQQVKVENTTAFDEDWANIRYHSPLFIDSNFAKDDVGKNVIYSSIITPFSPAIQPTYFFSRGLDNHPKEGKRSFGYTSNLPIKRSLQILYAEDYWTDSLTKIRFPIVPIPNSRVEFRNLDSSKYVFLKNGEKIHSNLYTTQFTCTRNDIPIEIIKSEMIHVIERNFGIKTYMEKQIKECFVIRRNGLPIPEYKGGKLDYRMGTANDTGFVSMNNVPFKQFVNFMILTFKNSNYPIIDETGFAGRLGLLTFKTTDKELTFQNLKSNLARFGLALTIEKREVDILVIEKE